MDTIPLTEDELEFLIMQATTDQPCVLSCTREGASLVITYQNRWAMQQLAEKRGVG